MKVLLINKFHYIHGGSETYYFALADLLRSMNHEVVFFSMRNDRNFPCAQAEYFAPNVDYTGEQPLYTQLCAGLKLIYSRNARRRLRKLLDAEKPDIAHVNLVHRQLTFSVIDELHKRGIPIVYTIHDYICICPNYQLLAQGQLCEACPAKKSFWPCVQKRCVKDSALKSLLAYCEAVFLKATRRYDKINMYIAPSRFVHEKYQSSGFTHSQIVFLRNFLPVDMVYEAKPSFDGRLLFFGRLSQEKGVMTLLQAIKKIPNAVLDIAGVGPLREKIIRFIQSNALGNRVKLLGFLQKQEMQNIITKCKAVIVPSDWYENCPYSIMEAQAQGKPIIGSDIGGIPELIANGKTGYIFKAGDAEALAEAVRKLAALDVETYRKMCDSARVFAKLNYDYVKYGMSLTGMYQKLIETAQLQ